MNLSKAEKILKPFCSSKPTRYHIECIGIRDRIAWATDGRVLIGLPVDDPETSDFKFPDMTEFADDFAVECTTVLLAEAIPDCPRCKNAAEIKCDNCNGGGQYKCFECGHNDRCGNCDGKGITPCDDCHAGFKLRVTIHESDFAPGYLRQILTLGSVRYGQPANKEDHHRAPLPFRFNGGGRGLLMPLQRR